MKRIWKGLILTFILILLNPNKIIKAETVEEHLNNLIAPQTQYSTGTASATNLGGSSANQNIDPKTGRLKLTQTDFMLPGRNGLNLEIKRIYNSDTSNLHEMKSRYENGVWVDYVSSDVKTSSFYEDRYNLGIGQRFSFPTIEVKKNSDGSSYMYLHSESGDIYRIINNKGNYSIEGHESKDLVVKEDNTYSNGQSDGTSKYVFIDKNGKKTYFSEDGRILSIKDRYDNTIKFEYCTNTYTTDNYTRTRRLISKITDTIGRVVSIDYKEDENYVVPSNSDNDTSGDLEGQFKVIISLPDDTPNTFDDNKKIVYDKSSVLASKATSHSIRERIKRIYGTDGEVKYRFWFEQVNAGFTFQDGSNYSATNAYENLVQIDDYKSNRLVRYDYGTFAKKLNDKGSMEHRKIIASKELSKTGYDSTKNNFLDRFIFDTKNVVNYTYTNDPSGYGVAGYNGSDTNYLNNTYRYYTEKVDSLGVKTKFTYSGTNILLSTEKVGNDSKEITRYEYGINKFPSKNIKETYTIKDGKPSDIQAVSLENFTYDDLGNLTSYTDQNANRDKDGNPTDSEHTTNYTYDNSKFNILKSKTWKTSFGSTAKLENDISSEGNITQTRESSNSNVKVTDFKFDKYGNIISKNIHNADNAGNSYVENYEYGVDEDKNDTQGAYLTKSYTNVGGKEVAKKFVYDLNTSNKIAEIDANNNRTSYDYDIFNRTTKITYPDSSTKEYTYNDHYSSNNDVDVKDQNGNLVKYRYDSLGNLVECIENGEFTTDYTYDAHNNKIEENNVNGDITQYQYNSDNKLIKKSFLEGGSTETKSMSLDYSTGTQNKNSIYKYDFGQKATYSYHGFDISVVKGNKYKYSFDAYISPDADIQSTGSTFIADGEKGFASSFKYDNTKKGKWQHFEVEAAATDSLARVLLYPSASTIPATKGYVLYKNVQFKESNTDNNLFNTVLNNSDFGVKGNGIFECLSPVNQVTVTDEENNVSILSYDKKNRIMMSEIAPGKTEDSLQCYVYDYVGNKINETDGNNNSKSYNYDNSGNLIAQYDSLGNKAQYSYDVGGKKISETNANNVTTSYDYDALGRMIRKREPSTDSNVKVTRYVYDNVGNLTKEIAPKFYDASKDKPDSVNSMPGNATTYDNMNRKDTIYDANNQIVEKFKYDSNGNVIKDVSGKNFNGNIDTSAGNTYEYDYANRKTKVTDAKGNSTSYTYTLLGDVETVKDAKGNVTNYSYNSDGTLASVKYPDGGNVKYTYNKLKEKVSAQDQLGNVTNYEYNPLGKVKKETDPYGNTTEYNYDKVGNIISVKDKRGNVAYSKYDEDNRLTNVKYPIDLDINKAIRYATENYSYDAIGNLVTKDISGTDNANDHRIINYSYYKNNLLDTKKNNSGGIEKNYYDLNNNLIKTENFLTTDKTNISKFEYDNNNRIKKSIQLVDEADINNTSSIENIASLRDQDYPGKIQMITGYEYDIQGNKTKEISPKAYQYGDSNKENRDNYSTTFVYNELNQLEKVQYKYDGKDVTNAFTYDQLGNQIKSVDEKGNTTLCTYNSMNQVETVVDPLNRKSIYKYDLNGNKTTFTNAKGDSTTIQYDKLNRLVSVTNPLNQVVVKNVYDANGNKVKVIDGNGYVSGNSDDTRYGVIYKYNLANNLVEEINPELQAKSNGSKDSFKYVYDSYGEITKKVDALGNETNYNYDNSGNLIKVTDAMGNSTSFSYDKNGNKTYMKDGLNRETFYSYSISGLLNNVKDPEGKVVSYKYDLNGNLENETDKNGNNINYSYDNKNQLVSRAVPKTGDSISYSFDVLGNRKEMKDSTGVTSYEYDANSQLLNVKKDGNLQLTYTYDELGNRNSMTDSKAFKTTYTYDKASRLNTVNYAGKTVTYNYDNNSNKKSIVYPGGSAETISYDKDNRLTSIYNKTSGGVVISKYDYTYYDNGLQSSKKDDLGVTNYEYNKNGAITKVTAPKNTTTFSYDGVNNRLSQIENNTSDQASGYIDNSGKELKYRNKESKYTYDNNNKLSNVVEQISDEKNNKLLQKTSNYTYDNNGNQIKEDVSYLEQVTTTSATTTNQNNNITTNQFDGFNRLKKVETTKGINKSTTEFNYNGDDLRTKKTTIDSKNNNLTEVTNYLYDGQNVILESNDKDQLTNRYVMGDDYLSRLDANNESSYYMYNGHGDVVQTVDESGNVENKYNYDSFGNSTLADEKYSNPIRYSGEFYDSSTGLYYQRARYYNPKAGRFISEDSYTGEEYNPSSLNRYTYCNNEPVLNIDPSGHSMSPAVNGIDISEILESLGAGATVGEIGAYISAVAPELAIAGVTAWGIYELIHSHSNTSSGSASSPFNLNLDWGASKGHSGSSSWSMPNMDLSGLDLSIPDINIPDMDFSDLVEWNNSPKPWDDPSWSDWSEFDKAMDALQEWNNSPKPWDNPSWLDWSEFDKAMDALQEWINSIDHPKKIDVNISDFHVVEISTPKIDTNIIPTDPSATPIHLDITPTDVIPNGNITSIPIDMPRGIDDYTEVLYPDVTSVDSGIIVDNADTPRSILDGLEVLNPTRTSISDGIIDDDFNGGRNLVPLILMATEETTRVRHYTNRKGINGIEQDGSIIAKDNNRVYVEPANKKPLSQVQAETKYQIKTGKGRDYVEFDVPNSQLEWVKNPRYGTPELTIKDGIEELLNPKFVRRK